MESWLFIGVIFALSVVGMQFIRGKWLRLISGNTKAASKNAHPQRRIGKIVGRACLLVTCVLVLFQRGLLSMWIMYVIVALTALGTVVVINQTTRKE